MRHIAIWHCCWYGPYDPYVMLAETEELLEAKVRGAIAEGWDDENDGPMPEDFSELLKKYATISNDTYYFDDWGYTALDSTLCEPVGDER